MKYMKKFIFIIIFLTGFMSFGSAALANGDDDHTAREEAEGKEVWIRLQDKKLTCVELTDDDFGVLGEYFMGQMLGSSHKAMNDMMTQMMGENGEKQMHVVMGKRLSGCEPAAAFPAAGSGFMPMMQMMTGGFGFNNNNNMMTNFGYGAWGWFGWIFMIFWWVLVLAVVVALIRWLVNQFMGGVSSGGSALDILKERYARGEIGKEEFEEKKKDLTP